MVMKAGWLERGRVGEEVVHMGTRGGDSKNSPW